MIYNLNYKGLPSWLSCVLCFLVFCHFSKCVLVHIRVKGEVGAVKLVKYFYWPFQGDTSFMDHLCFSVLHLVCFCARLLICYLWSPVGKGLTSWLSFVVSNCEVISFPLIAWVRCGTWFVSIPDLCTITYLECLNNISLIIGRNKQHEVSLIKKKLISNKRSTICTHWNTYLSHQLRTKSNKSNVKKIMESATTFLVWPLIISHLVVQKKKKVSHYKPNKESNLY